MDLHGEDMEIVFVPRLGRKGRSAIIPIAGDLIQFVLNIIGGQLVPVVVTGSFSHPEVAVKPGYLPAKPVLDLIHSKSPK